MNKALTDAKAIFLAALEKESPEERARYLDEACKESSDLRGRVEQLLRAHEHAGNFLGGSEATVASQRSEVSTDGAASAGGHSSTPTDEISLDFLRSTSDPQSLGLIGQYRVTGVIGRGGMGIVLRAFDEKLLRMVAIKVMAPEVAVLPEARQRFVREAQAAAAVRHDNVVDIHAVEDAGPIPYLVMELVEGTSLEHRLKERGLPELVETLRIGLQITEALAAAHRQGLVHRDVKPGNILLEHGRQRVKVTDFGLARTVDEISTTQPGLIAGTPAYMSPEQARGENVDCRSDLFSLGSVLYALCAGQAPFRAGTTFGILKKVCEESPRPIRELNPYVPDWLANLIENLLAKDPDERYQSAAEVADLLSQFLAFAQQAGTQVPVIIVKSRRKRQKPKAGWLASPARRRWLLIATATVVLMGFVLGLTEAGGVTQLSATVIRIFTPSGTLVVETDDPGVRVTIEGGGGLVITGAGPQEVRLQPGSYWVRANKDGTPMQADRGIVTIQRGDKQVVRVRMESDPPPAAPPAANPAAKLDDGPFVVAGRGGERRYDTLAKAVINAPDGGTIEIRGNGPFISDPITMQGRALTIRAAEGVRPVIKLRSEAVEGNSPLITANASLVLEGLELHRAPHATRRAGGQAIVQTYQAPLRAANCRFRAGIYADHAPVCAFRNCEFLAEEGAVGCRLGTGARLVMENCLHRTNGAAIGLQYDDPTLRNSTMEVKRGTFVNRYTTFWTKLDNSLPAGELQGAQRVCLDVSNSIFAAASVLGFEQSAEFLAKAALLQPPEAQPTLMGLLQWRGARNAFASGSTTVRWHAMLQPPSIHHQSPHGPTRLSEWKQFWGDAETDSLEGQIRFQGGDVLSRADAALDQLTPEDFRLSEGSFGYRASPDGKDLGADMDFVGPGPAYERWKKTPEYEDWLKETTHATKAEVAKPELGPFVALSQSDATERRFRTLADAIRGAKDGDTIEIRHNGPFGLGAISSEHPLTIRAGDGFRPILRCQPGDKGYGFVSNAALVLEGLEIQCQLVPDGRAPKGVINCFRGSLAIANCRLIGEGPVSMLHCWESPAITVQNCELLNSKGDAISWTYNSQGRLTIDNSVAAARNGRFVYARNTGSGEKLSIHISRTTALMGWGLLGFTADSTGLDKQESSDAAQSPLSVELVTNVFDAPGPVVTMFARGKLVEAIKNLPPDQQNIKLAEVLAWRTPSNLYSGAKDFFVLNLPTAAGQRLDAGIPRSEFAALIKLDDADSPANQLLFEGGNLRDRLSTEPLSLKPDDFRLREEGAGRRAGPGGKDLGADIDLVGPGPGYERWKKTPEYQEWLRETRQVK